MESSKSCRPWGRRCYRTRPGEHVGACQSRGPRAGCSGRAPITPPADPSPFEVWRKAPPTEYSTKDKRAYAAAARARRGDARAGGYARRGHVPRYGDGRWRDPRAEWHGAARADATPRVGVPGRPLPRRAHHRRPPSSQVRLEFPRNITAVSRRLGRGAPEDRRPGHRAVHHAVHSLRQRADSRHDVVHLAPWHGDRGDVVRRDPLVRSGDQFARSLLEVSFGRRPGDERLARHAEDVSRPARLRDALLTTRGLDR